jgi:hypothetical protein
MGGGGEGGRRKGGESEIHHVERRETESSSNKLRHKYANHVLTPSLKLCCYSNYRMQSQIKQLGILNTFRKTRNVWCCSRNLSGVSS